MIDDENIQLILDSIESLRIDLGDITAGINPGSRIRPDPSATGAFGPTGGAASHAAVPSIFGSDRGKIPQMLQGSISGEDIAQLRSELAKFRNLNASGSLSDEMRNQIRGVIGEMQEQISQTQKDITAKFEETKDESARSELIVQLDGLNSLVTSLDATKSSFTQGTEKMSKVTAGLVTSFVSALGIQQYIMMRAVQQPFQYQTRPALAAMGNTGMMGDVLSGAYGAQESVLQSYRGMTVQGGLALGGVGALGLGALGMARGNPLMAGLLAAGSLAAGGLAANAVKDPMANLLAGGMDSTAFNMELGRRILDPQKYAQDFFMPTLQARMGLGLGLGDETAATELSEMTSAGAKALGYDVVTAGQLSGAFLSTLSPSLAPQNTEQASELLDRMAGLESFGVSRDMILGLMGDISRAGSENFDQTLSTILAATSDNGEITNFTANVLVPALTKVIESRSIQNIAKSSEQVEKETAGLFSFFKTSDTNLGKMLSANPEVMSQVFGMLNQVGETALQDPALMLYLNRMGLSFSDVITGDPRTLLYPMQAFAQHADFNLDGSINKDSAATMSSVVGFLTMSGVGVNLGSVNLAMQMMEALHKGDIKGAESISDELKLQTSEGILRQLSDRLDAISETEGGQTMTRLVEQTDTFYKLMEEHTGEMANLQTTMQRILNDSTAISARILEASKEIETQLARVMGSSGSSGSGGSRGGGGGGGGGATNGGGGVRNLTPREIRDARERAKSENTPSVNLPGSGLFTHHYLMPGTSPDSDTFSFIPSNRLGNQIVMSRDEVERLFGENWQSTIGLGLPEHAVGGKIEGFTGNGNRLEPVGVVHGGEYVISDNNVAGNRSTLERIQSGERFDDFTSMGGDSFTQAGDTIRVTLEFSNVNPDEIINAAKISARQILYSERLL